MPPIDGLQLAERFDVVGQKQRLGTHPGRCQCGFRAGVTTADNNNVKFNGIKHGDPTRREVREPVGKMYARIIAGIADEAG
jgi:hypothetical protein